MQARKEPNVRRELKRLAQELNTLMREAREQVVPVKDAQVKLEKLRAEVELLVVPASDSTAQNYATSLKAALNLAEPSLRRLSNRLSSASTDSAEVEDVDDDEIEIGAAAPHQPNDSVAAAPRPKELAVESNRRHSGLDVRPRHAIATRNRSQSRSWDAADSSHAERTRQAVPAGQVAAVAASSPRRGSLDQGDSDVSRAMLRMSLEPGSLGRDDFVKCFSCSSTNRKDYKVCRTCGKPPPAKK